MPTPPQRHDLLAALRRHFGHTAFRPQQEEVVRHLLAGGDALVLMATGDGKSLCFQLPALLLDGLTLVVSPLIALMDDQVAALQRKGVPATCVHSMLEAREREGRLRAALAGEVKLLYLTPERFRVEGFLERITAVRIALLAIDEAHCVSQWGHDFRPDYGQLGAVREALGRPPCAALTATATPDVQADIRRVLDLAADAPLFHTGIERANLFLSVHEVASEDDKLPRLLELLDTIGGPAIVYFALIRDLERVEDELRRRGLSPLVYHGKLSAAERRDQQQRFLAAADALILATNAFGMGVDKPDIRAIVHWQIPRTLEAYYQEVGRAGRDGRGSVCELLFFAEDVQIQRAFTDWVNPDLDLLRGVMHELATAGERLHAIDLETLRDTFLTKSRHDGRVDTCLRLLATAGCCDGELGRSFRWLRTPGEQEMASWLPPGKRERDLQGLLAMARYASQHACRKATVHEWFGFGYDQERCTACDVHADPDAWVAEHLPSDQRRPIAGSAADPAVDLPVRRGEWIEVQGHGLCAVKRVHARGRSVRVDVERARDLTARSFDLGRVRWRKVQ